VAFLGGSTLEDAKTFLQSKGQVAFHTLLYEPLLALKTKYTTLGNAIPIH
jgi:hypothetical protein